MSLGNSLVVTLPDGRYTMSDAGASYFAQLSLGCVSKTYPHYFYKGFSEKVPSGTIVIEKNNSSVGLTSASL